MGKSIYRFRTISKHSIDNLINDELFGVTPDNFNDSYDSLFLFDLDKLHNLLINDSTCLELMVKDLQEVLKKDNSDASKEECLS